MLFDELDAVGGEAVAQREHGVAIGQAGAEVHPIGARDRVLRGSESEREAGGVIEHQDAVVVVPGGLRAETEIGFVEAARALLIANGERQMIHR